MNSLGQFPLNQQNHSDNLSTIHTPLKRTRAKRSCDFCRKRKSRCDADSSTPCSNCKAWGYTCEFETVRKKRGPPSVYVDNLEKKCKKMESLLQALTQCSIEDLERDDFQYSGNKDTDSESEEIVDEYDSIQYTGQSSTGLNLLDLFKSKSFINWPGKENTVLKLMSQNELMVVTNEEKSNTFINVGLSMKSPLYGLSIGNLKTSKKPARHQLDKIIGIYFSHLHSVLPIINKNKFLSQYHSSKTQDSILVQAVLALTFRFASKYLPDSKDEYSDIYFKKVNQSLKDCNRSKLSHVQASILIVLYLDMEQGNVESMQWNTLGHAIRMAQDLGLYRSCSGWNLPRSEIETRHRVFYACYVMDRWHGARTGKPMTILDGDFDTEMPSPYEIKDDSNFESGQGLPVYQIFILFIRLSEILGFILKSFYSPNSNLDDTSIISVFDKRLNHWKDSLDEPFDGVFLTELDKLNLKIYCSTVILLLRRRFSTLSTKEYPHLTQEITESEKICTSTALELNEILIKRQYQTIHPAYYTIFCAPSCFIYSLFQSSLVFLSNALKTKSITDIQILHQSIDMMKKYNDIGSTERTLEILQMLISIHNLDSKSTKISPIIPITSKKSKSFYFQQRSLHDTNTTTATATDLKMGIPEPSTNYYRRQQEQMSLNCYLPVYSHSNYSHQRSISLDQLNSQQQQQQQQQVYTHHTRSISHDDLAIITNNNSIFQRNQQQQQQHIVPFNQTYTSFDPNIPNHLNWSDWDVYINNNNNHHHHQNNNSSSSTTNQY